jgi:hypothetical protein
MQVTAQQNLDHPPPVDRPGMMVAERFGQASGNSLRERRGAVRQLSRRQWLVEG